jgi:pimeloyl-ACP methyl ester carboxylesterase
MEFSFLETTAGRVHVLKFGHGPRLLIALHGFSDHARMFSSLEQTLQDQYTVVAFDLPFHGQTSWHNDCFSPADLWAILTQILQKEGKTRFSLMGFSFGARLALGTLPLIAPQLDQLFLLSPDGIKTMGLRWATATPIWVRRMIFKSMKKPGWLLNLANLVHKIGFLPADLHGFVKKNLSHPTRIQRSFGCWLSMDSFSQSPFEMRRLLQEIKVPTAVFYGAMDPFIHSNTLEKAFRGIPNVQLIVLEHMGHNIFGPALHAAMTQQISAEH